MTAFILNITFACRDPFRLAQFWADITGYSVDPGGTPERVRLTQTDPRGVRHLLFRAVEEPRSDTRIHLDLAAKDPLSEIERILALGATLVDERDDNGQPAWRTGPGKGWVVLRDPEGNEFCLG